MVKPRGALCNLACDYCFYLSKKELYPSGSFRTSDGLLDEFSRQYIEAQPGSEVTFAWQGGEPTLMGLDFFQLAVEIQERYSRPGMRVINALQTNGTLLDDDWCRFFKRNDFLIGLSLDGPREFHDAFRHDKGGGATFDRVMTGYELLKKHGVEVNILACVNALNDGYPLETYRFFRDEIGARFLQFIPIVERADETDFFGRDPVTERSASGREYGQFLIKIFDEWVRRDVGQIYVQIFDVALAAWLGHRPGLCVFDETCGAAMALEHNGDLYACDHFVEPARRLGNILDSPLIQLVGSEGQRQFGRSKRDTLPQYCLRCPVRFVCNGGCPKNRVLETEDGVPGLNYLCEGYRAFFQHIDRPMQIMAAELRSQRPPARIMLYLAEEEAERQSRFARLGRNDPCPCGSGRKVKHCCGRPGKGTN